MSKEQKNQTEILNVIESFNTKKGGYISFSNLRTDEELNTIEKLVDQFIGKFISVDCVERFRHEIVDEPFANTIRVSGVLEKNEDRGQYRVLAKDSSSYSYFRVENVSEIGTYGDEKEFKSGAKAVIGIKL
jgi:hypothetical protein